MGKCGCVSHNVKVNLRVEWVPFEKFFTGGTTWPLDPHPNQYCLVVKFSLSRGQVAKWSGEVLSSPPAYEPWSESSFDQMDLSYGGRITSKCQFSTQMIRMWPASSCDIIDSNWKWLIYRLFLINLPSCSVDIRVFPPIELKTIQKRWLIW